MSTPTSNPTSSSCCSKKGGSKEGVGKVEGEGGEKNQLKGNADCSCPCDICYCGPNCKCTETLCRCAASSVLNSLKASTQKNRKQQQQQQQYRHYESKSSCCSSASASTSAINNSTSSKYVDPLASPPPPATPTTMTTTTTKQKQTTIEIGVSGMTCSMCTKAIETALKKVPGVASVSVSLATHSAMIMLIDSNPNNNLSSNADTTTAAAATTTKIIPPSRETLVETIEALGYEVVDYTEATNNSNDTNTKAIVECSITGMTCAMCSQAIERALRAMDGIHHVSVSLATNIARIEYDPSIIHNVNDIQETIQDIGYDVIDITVINNNKSNNNNDDDNGADGSEVSQDRLERLLQQQRKEVSNRKRAFLWSLAGTIPIFTVTMILPLFGSVKWTDFLHATIKIGPKNSSRFVVEALILWVLCTPIQFGCGWPFYRSSWYGFQQGILGMDVLVAVGTTASYGYATWATLAGSMEYHFFETSAVLICFVLLGKWMQSLAVRRTSQALTQLLELQPKTAIQIVIPSSMKKNNINNNNDEEDDDDIGKTWNPATDPFEEKVVPLKNIHTGDIVKVLKGASVPADGIVLFGEMSVDESMITGESIPVLKTKGSIVLGGTICAESGREAAFVKVTGVGSSTALSQIVQLVQNAQNRQVPIQNLADQISGIFVPTVVTISVITFMVWYALCQSEIVPASWLPNNESPATFSLLFGIACLVISCPCALGLATPTAVMVGTGVGAKQGVLMKGGETLELASRVDSIVFDKTGTLTKGKPAITDFAIMVTEQEFWTNVMTTNNCATSTTSSNNSSEDLEEKKPPASTINYLLWLLGSLERNSEHPLAGAIVAYAEEKLQGSLKFSPPSNFVALTGRGAAGTIQDNIRVAVGNRAFCEIQGLNVSAQVETCMQKLERQGKTAIVAAVNSTVCVVMGIADELKPDAGASISYLKNELGIDVWMVTGDNRRTAYAIARQLNLPPDRVIAEALPVAKVEQVEKLQQEGRIVAMVGDGVNDSPALAQANVGLGLGAGAEIAAEASDMVLVRGNVSDVCTALHLSKVIFRRIQLNLLLSLLYNSLSIPLAAGVFYPFIRTRVPPTLAALAMALSSVSVVCSSLALRFYRPPQISSTIPGSSSLTATATATSGLSGPAQLSRSNASTKQQRTKKNKKNHNTNDDEGLSSNPDLTQPLLDADTLEGTSNTNDLSELEEGRRPS